MDRFFESFDKWDSDYTALTIKGWQFSGFAGYNGTYYPLVAGTALGKALSRGVNNSISGGFRRITGNHSHYIFGLDVRHDTATSDVRQFACSRNGGSKFLQLVIDASNKIAVILNSTTIYTHTTAMTLAQFYYVEVEHKVHATAGIIKVYIDDTLVYSFTGNTQGSATNAYINACEIFDTDTYNAMVSIDNFYYLESDGGVSRLGPITIETFSPIADGSLSGWSLTGSITAWNALNDTYTTASSPNITLSGTSGELQEDFNASLFSNPLTIHDVLVNVQIRITDVGPVPLQVGVYTDDDTWHYSSTVQAKKNVGDLYTFSFKKNPKDNSDWDYLTVQSADFGIKIT